MLDISMFSKGESEGKQKPHMITRYAEVTNDYRSFKFRFSERIMRAIRYPVRKRGRVCKEDRCVQDWSRRWHSSRGGSAERPEDSNLIKRIDWLGIELQ